MAEPIPLTISHPTDRLEYEDWLWLLQLAQLRVEQDGDKGFDHFNRILDRREFIRNVLVKECAYVLSLREGTK